MGVVEILTVVSLPIHEPRISLFSFSLISFIRVIKLHIVIYGLKLKKGKPLVGETTRRENHWTIQV